MLDQSWLGEGWVILPDQGPSTSPSCLVFLGGRSPIYLPGGRKVGGSPGPGEAGYLATWPDGMSILLTWLGWEGEGTYLPTVAHGSRWTDHPLNPPSNQNDTHL